MSRTAYNAQSAFRLSYLLLLFLAIFYHSPGSSYPIPMPDPTTTPRRIDVHHHYLPDFYRTALEANGGDTGNFGTPEWSLNDDNTFCQQNNITTAIFSISSPGVDAFPDAQAVAVVRQVNEYGAGLRDSYPKKYGFFAALPSLLLKDAVIKEIEYSLDTLHADGVTFFTSYDNASKYLGHADFKEIWSALNTRNATIFIHPTYGCSLTPVSGDLSVSTLDFPQETTRTIMDMVRANTIRDNPNVKIIVSHAGGTLPYIFGRLAHGLHDTGKLKKTPEEFMKEMRTLYYDTATSKYDLTLDLLGQFADTGNILFGSDFPYHALPAVEAETKRLDEYLKRKGNRAMDGINADNALKFLPRLRE